MDIQKLNFIIKNGLYYDTYKVNDVIYYRILYKNKDYIVSIDKNNIIRIKKEV